MPAWHKSHYIRTRMKHTNFTSVRRSDRLRRVRRVGGSRRSRCPRRRRGQQGPTCHRCHDHVAGTTEKLHPGIIHRTAFHGIRKLLKLLEKTHLWVMTNAPMTNAPLPLAACFSRTHHTSRSLSLLAVVHVSQQLLLTVSNLKGSPHS